MIPLGTLSARGILSFQVDYLVIAGGGGGGNYAGFITNCGGGGGGAGGYRTSYGTSGRNSAAESPLTVVEGVSYTVTRGGGGAAYSQGSPSVFASITSTGGGRGGRPNLNEAGGTGGSAGGGGGANTVASRGAGTAAQGSDGGSGFVGAGNQGYGGGGGGASAAGQDGAIASLGNGGNGLANTITGSPVTRAGGGGGGSRNENDTTPGGGGSGGGGLGAYGASTGQLATSGAVNTGSGGGGGGGNYQGYNINRSIAGEGGSGVVILRYPSSFTITTTGLTASTATVGADKVTTITAGTGTVTWAA
jgi:hypothetical protein